MYSNYGTNHASHSYTFTKDYSYVFIVGSGINDTSDNDRCTISSTTKGTFKSIIQNREVNDVSAYSCYSFAIMQNAKKGDVVSVDGNFASGITILGVE